ncbi:pyridoxamine 5'-phosphate oxidase [Solimonas marina]|uniref:Pyridoxine/pyridoxamine 5'-phosphate oxidase n=1 Tax=Solimonas marina TaxID=2714601 RepID=A0A969W765_9GAMM|nr:pyridoxamine 5'-phosphate oxidase [Solimonas marina]NKF20733.1 pyridoxamine 5'-phosphate oxidase [Solimonas marina]
MPQYNANPPLNVEDLDADPLAQLQLWLDDARRAEIYDPTAMTLATVDSEGKPSARIVLFKGFYEQGLTFYTNYESRKGAELAANPNVALVFWWDRLERSVRVEGAVSKLPRPLSERYFHSRLHESQVSALTSKQSAVVTDRDALDARFNAALEQYAKQPVPLPDFWGGYRVEPRAIEFWQGRHGRLHDRLRYRRDDGTWRIERLEP